MPDAQPYETIFRSMKTSRKVLAGMGREAENMQVSGNDVSGGLSETESPLSGNDISGNDVSGNSISGNSISENSASGKSCLLYTSGKSSAGKDTIYRSLLECESLGLNKLIRCV